MSPNFYLILISVFFFSGISCEKYNSCNFLSGYLLKPLFGKYFCHDNPDVSSKTPNLITRHNFTSQTYKLVTSDGYILTLFRIPPKDKSKPVVFLQHGIIMNSEIFVASGPKSLALWLAGMGHEVWLGNLRGTSYSKEHVNISSQNNEYWDFNQDKLAMIDIREQLQYVNNITQKPVIYVGYSMGTTLMLMYASEYPEEVQCLVKGFVALSPIAYMTGMRASFIVKAVFTPLLTIHKLIDNKVLFYDEVTLQKIVMKLCNVAPHICIGIVHLFAGRTKNLSAENMQLVFSHVFQATARDVSLQYLQNIYSGEFKHFDYGTFKNIDVYGKGSPPKYDLKRIKLPVFLFHGLNDALSSEANAQKIYNDLGSDVKKLIEVPERDRKHAFNHLDFLYSDNIERQLNIPLYKIVMDNLS